MIKILDLCSISKKSIFGDFQLSVTAGAGDGWAVKVWGDFEVEAAKTGQEYKAVDLSHNVNDLVHLLFRFLLLFLFCSSFSYCYLFRR